MSITEIRQLPRIEKLKLMEALWADLSADDGSFESPAWHVEALRKTDESFSAGREELVDWAEAKKRLRNAFE